jgi:hypothetical protein
VARLNRLANCGRFDFNGSRTRVNHLINFFSDFLDLQSAKPVGRFLQGMSHRSIDLSIFDFFYFRENKYWPESEDSTNLRFGGSIDQC